MPQPEAPTPFGSIFRSITPCWLITFLLMQFFGARNLGALTPADQLWL
jgi:hypothetical protein